MTLLGKYNNVSAQKPKDSITNCKSAKDKMHFMSGFSASCTSKSSSVCRNFSFNIQGKVKPLYI